MVRFQAPLADDDHLTRIELAHQIRVDEIECARFGGQQMGVPEAAKRQRPESAWIAHSDDAIRCCPSFPSPHPYF